MTATSLDDLDAFDRRLLTLLQRDSRLTGVQLSEAIGLSAAACLRRVQRLRQIGAIEREVAVLSPAFTEKRTTILVRLTIDRHNLRRVNDFTQRLLRLDAVDTVYSVTGEDDFIAILRCASIEEFADIADAHFYQPPVEGYESNVVLRAFQSDQTE